MRDTVVARKFAGWEVPELSTLKYSKVYALREKLNSGGKLNREEKNFIAEKINSNAYFKDSIPLRGWRFNFSDCIKPFLVKQYGVWTEYKAPDKTSIRNILFGRIDKIVEVEREV